MTTLRSGRRWWAGLAVLAATAAATAVSGAALMSPHLSLSNLAAAAKVVAALPSGMTDALQRDLHWSRQEVIEREARTSLARPITEQLRARLGTRFGGAWLNEAGDQLGVAVTEPGLAATVRGAGAKPVLVRYGLTELSAIVARLSERPSAAADSWYVDVRTNRVVVEAADADAAGRWIRERNVDAEAVRIVPSKGAVTTTIDGGQGYQSTLGCSAGFGVRVINDPTNAGFLTAGHCGRAGAFASGGGASGSVEASVFPDFDFAYVRLNDPTQATPFVTDYSGGRIGITGVLTPGLYAEPVCKSGQTTKWTCGLATQYDVAANAKNAQGQNLGLVIGLVKTTACAAEGDSGGPMVTRTFAVGIVSSRQGVCGYGGVSFYTPVQTILNRHQLELLMVPPQRPPLTGEVSCASNTQYPEFGCVGAWINGEGFVTATLSIDAVPLAVDYFAYDNGVYRGGSVTTTNVLYCPSDVVGDVLVVLDLRDEAGQTFTTTTFFHCDPAAPPPVIW
jgi:streptogrisin C